MSDYTNKELLDAMYDIRDRVTRIEEKLNRTEKLEDKVEAVSEKAQKGKDVGEEAYILAKANQEEIKSIKANSRWAWGLAITSLLGLLGEFLGIKIN